jgi:hypothetical protein
VRLAPQARGRARRGVPRRLRARLVPEVRVGKDTDVRPRPQGRAPPAPALRGLRRHPRPCDGAILEDRRLPVTAWAELLLAIMPFESLAGVARRGRRSPAAPACQLAKPLMALGGIQGAAALSGRAQAGEVAYPAPAAGRGPCWQAGGPAATRGTTRASRLPARRGSAARRPSASWGSAGRARSAPGRRTARTCPAAPCPSTTGRARATPWCESSGP